MAFSDDLLDQAYHLANLESGDPKQVSLRRAVSTPYYAPFHPLIDEAVGHWGVPRDRSILARTFDHGRMKGISEDRIRSFLQLRAAPSAFVWSRDDALVAIDAAAAAVGDWQAIRPQDAAQDFQLQLFLPKMPRL